MTLDLFFPKKQAKTYSLALLDQGILELIRNNPELLKDFVTWYLQRKKPAIQALPQDTSRQRQEHIMRCEELLRNYPKIPPWKLIEWYSVQTGIHKTTVRNYFETAGKRAGREWG